MLVSSGQTLPEDPTAASLECSSLHEHPVRQFLNRLEELARHCRQAREASDMRESLGHFVVAVRPAVQIIAGALLSPPGRVF